MLLHVMWELEILLCKMYCKKKVQQDIQYKLCVTNLGVPDSSQGSGRFFGQSQINGKYNELLSSITIFKVIAERHIHHIIIIKWNIHWQSLLQI